MNLESSPTLGHVAALVCAATWAMASLLFGKAAHAVDVRTLNLLKCGLAALLLGATSFALGDLPHIGGRDLLALAGSSLVGLVIADTAYFVALRELGAARGVLFVALVPVCTALLAVPVLHEPLTLPMLAGMALTLTGVTVVVRERASGVARSAAAAASLKKGVLGGGLYCTAQAGANVLTKSTDLSLSPLALSSTRMAMGALLLGILLLVSTRGSVPLQGVRASLPRVALAIFLGTYVGLVLGTYALRTVSAGVATTLVATTPLFALLFSLVTGERPSLRAAGGAVLALCGVALLFS